MIQSRPCIDRINFTFPKKVEIAQSLVTLCDLYSPWNSLGQNTGVGSLSLLLGIFPTQESNWGLLNGRWILYWAIRECWSLLSHSFAELGQLSACAHKLSANAYTYHLKGTHRMLAARQKTVWVRCGECWECLWASWGDLLIKSVGDLLMESAKQKNSHLSDAFQALPAVFPASPHS